MLEGTIGSALLRARSAVVLALGCALAAVACGPLERWKKIDEVFPKELLEQKDADAGATADGG
jgi:hypothetical protein